MVGDDRVGPGEHFAAVGDVESRWSDSDPGPFASEHSFGQAFLVDVAQR